MSISLKGLDGGTRAISESALGSLRAALRGTLCVAGEPGYDEARTLWNAMIDRRPGLVIRAQGAGDVQTAVTFARDNGLVISIRGGGHQIAGLAVADDTLLLDLSPMREVTVDPAARTASVEAGATLADVDRETQAHGLAVPLGINSTTGIAGLTLGGGFGWITRKFGLTIDQLISADIVTADGALRRASADETPDLFWAIRGGGGNFGVVTRFEFRLNPLGPEVLAGLIVHPAEAAPQILRDWRRICATAPDELAVWAVLRQAPPVPFLPEAWHGREILALAACYAGDAAEGEAAMAELRSLGTPIADLVGRQPYAAWQTALDPLLSPGYRNYWKSHDFLDMSDGLIEVLMAALHVLPDPNSEIAIAVLGGAMAQIPADATAFPQRAAHFTMNLHTRWQDPAKDDACIVWARDLFASSAPFAASSIYVNFIPEDKPDLSAAYGPNMQRLVAVKTKYDPQNLFRMNHNILPQQVALASA